MSNKPSIRKTDAPFNDPVQTSRFVDISGQWYFMTRERELQGPFAVRAAAETALQIYLQESSGRRSPGSAVAQQRSKTLYPPERYTVSHDEERPTNNVVDWHRAKATLLS